jgi:hypothetical protein
MLAHSQVNLVQSSCQTLPFENLKQVRLWPWLPISAHLCSLNDSSASVCILTVWAVGHLASCTQIRTLCVSPDGVLLLSVDEDGKALLINRK